MPDQRSLKEKLLDVLEEIDIIILDIADRIVVGRRPDAESQESITSLADSFQEQYIQFVQLVQSVPDHQERERKIRELETYAENRDKMLFNIAEQLIRTQDILDKNTMQAEQKLRSVHESENKRVFSEDVVRLANQISKGHSVTCSPDWQQGEPSRPFPTAADFAVSHLMRASLGANRTAQAPSTSATANLMGQLFRQQGGSAGPSPSAATLSRTGSSGALARSSPMAQYGGMPAFGALPGQQQKGAGVQFTQSPRTGGAGPRGGGIIGGSPRGRPPGGSALQSPNLSGSQSSPSGYAARQMQQMFPRRPSQSPRIGANLEDATSIGAPFSYAPNSGAMANAMDVDTTDVGGSGGGAAAVVEQMTSDSSSSSSSGDEASPGN